MFSTFETTMESDVNKPAKKERTFPSLDLSTASTLDMNTNQPLLLIQSPKTPTLSRKLKAVSLDSDPPKPELAPDISRDVFSMPNTPKKQLRSRHNLEYACAFDDTAQKSTLAPNFSSNLKRFASNNSISGSQTLKTLPEIMTLQDFSDSRPEPVRIKAKGLLERRGSNASLTIDLGSNSSIPESRSFSLKHLNTVKSISHLNLSTFGAEKCNCVGKPGEEPSTTIPKKTVAIERLKGLNKSPAHIETCGSCTIYESGVSKANTCKFRCYTFHKKCNCLCNFKCRRKSLSNENLYVPPCSFCQSRLSKDCSGGFRSCKGCRKAVYPRQPGLESSQLLSEDFKLHLQNVQYLQTAGSVLSVADLRAACEMHRLQKLHQEFWEVPLNLQEKCLVSGSQSKNRYKGVLPNEHSRVHLTLSQNYIHANYIKGADYTETAYIATQGPMTHTCEDFWEMIWCSKCKCIVMLTGLVEKGRSKCELYFPLGRSNPNPLEKSYFYVTTTKLQDRFTFDTKNVQKYEEEVIPFDELDELSFGKFRIKFVAKENLGECVVRQLELSKNDGSTTESCILYHYWFPTWQDHKMANPEQVLQIALHVLQTSKKVVGGGSNLDNKFSIISDVNVASVKQKLFLSAQSSINGRERRSPRRERASKMHNKSSHTRKPHDNTLSMSENPSTKPKEVQIKNKSRAPKLSQSESLDSQVSQQTRTAVEEILLTSTKTENICNNQNEVKVAVETAVEVEVDKPEFHSLPVVVHCSAGIGRTGCFLAILNGIQQLRTNFNVDILAILCSLRLNRGGMVQTAEQYELIHRVLNLYADSM